jgi:FtsH-binding integral membrane protein
MVEFKLTTWNLMYVAAVISALICVATVYQITVTGDTSNEWIIWIFVILGFCLFGFGFLTEGRHNKDQAFQPLPGEVEPKPT